MLKLFDVEIDEKQYPGLKDKEDYAILPKLNEKLKNKEIVYSQVQQYLLERKKDAEKMTNSEKDFYEKYFKEPLDASLQKEIESALSQVNAEFEQGKKEKEKEAEKKTEEDQKSDAEINPKEAQKSDAENKVEVEKREKAEKKEDTEKKDNEKRIDEKEIEEAVEKSAEKVNKRVKNVQKSLDELAKGGRGRALTEDDLIGGMIDFQRGELPQNDVIQYLQDLQESRRQNYQNGGAMEDNLLQERRDTIKGIGDEYQANREVTPALVEKKERLDAIDNVLINVTKYPKLLFLSMILMGLNPFLAIGLSVLAAFSKDMVQDIYKNLPKEDKSNLENRPAQQPQQPVDNKQIEEYQQKLAQAEQIMKEQASKFKKLALRDYYLTQAVQKMYSQLNNEQMEKERIEAEKAKTKSEVKAEKKDKPEAEKKENTKVTNEKAAATQKEKQEQKLERTKSKTL